MQEAGQVSTSKMAQSDESPPKILIERIRINSILLTVVLAIISVVTTTGNLLVIWTIYRNPRWEQRTISKLLVVNLAVADLMVGPLGEPLLIISHLVLKNSHNELANNFTTAAGVVLILTMAASSCTIYNLTLERYLSLEMPPWREKLFTGLPGKLSICCIWSFALLIAFLPTLIGKVDMIKLFHSGFFVFVAIVVIGLYMRMFIIIRKFNKTPLTQRINQPLVQPGHAYTAAKRREHSYVKDMFLFVGVYLVCYLPFCIASFNSYSSISIVAEKTGLILIAFLNSALNPVLYTFTMPRHRRKVKKILDGLIRALRLSFCR